MTPAQRVSYWAYRVAGALARRLPTPVATLAARVLGVVFARTMQGRRATIERHLQRIHRHAGGAPLDRATLDLQVQRAFDSYARYWVESFRLPSTSPEQLEVHMSYEGLEHLDRARLEGKGVIMALTHLGGWDYGGAWLATVGYPITVVVEPVEPPELFEWFAAFRRSLGLTVVPLGPEAGSAVLAALRSKQVVGLLCDRYVGGAGAEVSFFGERTTLPSGPATLALRTGAPIVPTTVYFQGRSGHLGIIGAPMSVQRRGSFRQDTASITQALADELERMIARRPEQWHVFQPNWPSDPGYRS